LPTRRRRRTKGAAIVHVLSTLARKRGIGTLLALTLLSAAIGAGAVRGGQYDLFVAEFGTLPDLAANALGFGIEGVTIIGAKELSEDEVLQASGITTRDSLPFLDASAIRQRLADVPIVKEVSVRKLYPARLVVEIEEREPYALWQKDGQVQVISKEGTAIDNLADPRLAHKAFVVGEDANLRVPEFLKILDNAGDLRERVRAGILVSGRRWNVKMESGLEIKLPESQPDVAFAKFVQMSREMRIMDKDISSVDLRLPDRMIVRLTADAAATRAELQNRKKSGRGGQI
jgi:cell division protein FtsQ